MNEIRCKIKNCGGSIIEWKDKKYILRCNKCNRQYRKCQKCYHLWLKRDILNPTIVCPACKSPYYQNSKKGTMGIEIFCAGQP